MAEAWIGRASTLLLCAAVIVTAGCDSSPTEAPNRSLEGSWLSYKEPSNTPGADPTDRFIHLGVTESATGSLTGSGRWADACGSFFFFDFSGEYNHPDVIVRMQAFGRPVTFQGTISADGNTLVGTLYGNTKTVFERYDDTVVAAMASSCRAFAPAAGGVGGQP